MISHILFNLFSKYNIGSFGFRKILAILITVLIFGLLYMTVRFTGIDIPNYTRNLAMLVTVDLAGFLFLMWKRPKEPPKEEVAEVVAEKEDVVSPVKIKPDNPPENPPELKASKILEKENGVTEEESESKITIKKIEVVEDVDEAEKL
jgi:hypothetical protein